MISWWLVSQAFAGACCVGSTSIQPTRLGECEHVAAAVAVEGRVDFARWKLDWMVAGASPQSRSLETSVAAGWRWSRSGQVQVRVPLRYQSLDAGSLHAEGGGVGDLAVGVVLDPFEEGTHGTPVFSVGARMPTGRDWTDVADPLQAGVTGLPGLGVSFGAAWERTLTKSPVAISAAGEINAGATPEMLTVSASVGRTVTPRLTTAVALREQVTFGGDVLWKTTVGGRILAGRPLRHRASLALDADVPVAYLGRSAPIGVVVSAGWALIR